MVGRLATAVSQNRLERDSADCISLRDSGSARHLHLKKRMTS